jgi:hypothetical protein
MARSLVRNPDFQKLWTAQSISVFGTQISVLAIPLTAAIILKVEPGLPATWSRCLTPLSSWTSRRVRSSHVQSSPATRPRLS